MRSTDPEPASIDLAIRWPCAGPGRRVLKMSMSNVPCRRSIRSRPAICARLAWVDVLPETAVAQVDCQGESARRWALPACVPTSIPSKISPMRVKHAAMLALVLAACGDDDKPHPQRPPVQITAGSPFPADCNGAPQVGTNYRGAEVEPFVAYDPNDPMHLVGVWQQDRWSNGGSNGLGAGATFDGGATWT